MDQAAGMLAESGRRHGPCDVDEYYRLADLGYFANAKKVELIDGELVWVNSVGSPHMSVVLSLTQLLGPAVFGRALLSVQNPVRFDIWNEPEPDVALLAPRSDKYRSRHPSAEDVLLLIEVAHTSLAHDSGTKRALYAYFGVTEYWIVDIEGGRIIVCREPTPNGYAREEEAGLDAVLSPAALPGIAVAVADILG